MKNNRKRLRRAKTYSLLETDIERVEKRAKELEITSAALLAQVIALYFETNPEK